MLFLIGFLFGWKWALLVGLIPAFLTMWLLSDPHRYPFCWFIQRWMEIEKRRFVPLQQKLCEVCWDSRGAYADEDIPLATFVEMDADELCEYQCSVFHEHTRFTPAWCSWKSWNFSVRFGVWRFGVEHCMTNPQQWMLARNRLILKHADACFALLSTPTTGLRRYRLGRLLISWWMDCCYTYLEGKRLF